MDQRYDFRSSGRPFGDKGDAAPGSDEDPLVELARIISGRSDGGARRGDADAGSADLESRVASDLEAELMADLQASFADIRALRDEQAQQPQTYEDHPSGYDEYAESAAVHPAGYGDETPAAAEAPAAFDEPVVPPVQPEPRLKLRVNGHTEASAPTPKSTVAFGYMGLRRGPAVSMPVGPAFDPPALPPDPAAEEPAVMAGPVPAILTGRSAASSLLRPEAPPWSVARPADGSAVPPPADRAIGVYEPAPVGAAAADFTQYVPGYGPAAGRAEADGRNRRPFYAAVAILGIIVVGIAAALALRGNAALGEPPTIAADTSSHRIMADPVAAPGTGNVVFNVASGTPAVGNETLLPGADEPIAEITSEAANDGISSILQPTAGAIPTTPAATAATDGPRMVRTVTVRPDGSVVENGAAPAGSTPVATPLAGPATNATPPTPRQVTTTPITTTPQQAQALVTNPPAATPAPAPAATPAPSQPAPAAGTATVSVTSTPPAGSYVQVSSQTTEAAARSSLAGIRAQAPSLVGSRAAVITPAQVNGATWYRVQIGPMTSAEASTLSSALVAAGMSNFIARH